MSPPLTDADRERFEALQQRLADVESAPVDTEPRIAQPGPVDPMLATSFEGDLDTLDEADWIAERKFDGTRIILQRFNGELSLFTRRHIDRAETLDEFSEAASETIPDNIILDGEYCFLTPSGRSRFLPIHQSKSVIAAEDLTGKYFIFDILAVDSVWCTDRPLTARKELLRDHVPESDCCVLVDGVTADFAQFFDDLVDRGEEGIILKRRTSRYQFGTRSRHWRKAKSFSERDLIVIGYTPGEGAREATFGALAVTDGEQYLGRVGSGFSNHELARLTADMTTIDSLPIAVDGVDRSVTPVEPFVISVKYQEINRHGKLRAPVFARERPEKPIEQVSLVRETN